MKTAPVPGRFELESAGRKVTYRLSSRHYAALRTARADEAGVLYRAEGLAVYAGKPPGRLAPDQLAPVYTIGDSPAIAVPTGRVLLRVTAGQRVADHRSEIEKAGFEIAEELSYAPNAAWVRPRDGGIGAALRGLAPLGRIPGVEHVEPQMLMPVARKADPRR